MATNRLQPSGNGHAKPAALTLDDPATPGQDVAEMQHAAEAALVDCNYAIRQLTTYRDQGRALDALERVKERLSEIVLG